jgi:hypothetical protein
MFVYNYRIFDRYNLSVASLAVLGDENINWQPAQFGYGLFQPIISFIYGLVIGGVDRKSYIQMMG